MKFTTTPGQAPLSGVMHGPIGPGAVHLCVDMQRLFSEDGPWPTPWMSRVLPVVGELARWSPERTIFTRYIPPAHPEEMPGRWQALYRHWREVTRTHLDRVLLELLPELVRLVPPAAVLDKTRYSALSSPAMGQAPRAREANCLVISGAETDVCIAATVLSAVDRGYRVIVVADAICSSSDPGHDAQLDLYNRRLALQNETATAEQVLRNWRR